MRAALTFDYLRGAKSQDSVHKSQFLKSRKGEPEENRTDVPTFSPVGSQSSNGMIIYVCMYVCVCVCERERERERESFSVCVCVCVCVCESE